MGDGEIMVRFEGVGKRYARGRRRGSLRDAIPALAARVARRSPAMPEDARDFWALRDVSFKVRHGEALGVIGHNGAGKSTILKLLAGVTAPTRGHAGVNGRFAALIELGAGFHPDLTGRENVYLNGSILGLKRSELDRKMESIVDFANLEKFIDTPVKHYSSGMHARLGFAVAAHVEPDVLLIDEVLSVGDFAFQQKCMKRMEQFRREGVAIVFVSHNLNAIANLCSKAILLQTGQVVAAGTPRNVIDAYTKAAYAVVSDEEAAQIFEMEHGRVTHHMRIVDADLYNADGDPTRSFLAGSPAVLMVRLRAQRDARDPIVGMGVRDQSGAVVYGASSATRPIAVGHVAAGEEIVVSYRLTLNLCQGTYSINAAAAPMDGGVMMDHRENLVTFDVFSNHRDVGVADLKAAISVERALPIMIEDRPNRATAVSSHG